MTNCLFTINNNYQNIKFATLTRLNNLGRCKAWLFGCKAYLLSTYFSLPKTVRSCVSHRGRGEGERRKFKISLTKTLYKLNIHLPTIEIPLPPNIRCGNCPPPSRSPFPLVAPLWLGVISLKKAGNIQSSATDLSRHATNRSINISSYAKHLYKWLNPSPCLFLGAVITIATKFFTNILKVLTTQVFYFFSSFYT